MDDLPCSSTSILDIRVGLWSSSVNSPRMIAGVSLSWFLRLPVKSTPRRKTVFSVSEIDSELEDDFLDEAMAEAREICMVPSALEVYI